MARLPTLTLGVVAPDDLDVLDAAASRVWAMINDEGYFYLTGPLVCDLNPAPVVAAAAAFFARPIEEKMRFHIARSAFHRGYLPTGEEGQAEEVPDLKEGFDTGLPQLLADGSDRPDEGWPDTPGFRAEAGRWRRRMEAVARTLALVFARTLGQPATYLLDRATDPPNQLRLLHYPGSPVPRQGVGVHRDFECFTLLAATGPGLEVERPDGSWVWVPPRPDSLVVTTGDLLEIITNGGLPAARHRVGWVTERRFAFPYFFSLDRDVVVAPLDRFVGPAGPHYRPVRAGEHLMARTTEVFRYLRDAGRDAQP
ncbi:Aminocyclopropanecarboxylate oxidase [Micromonospora noduli]|uniref:isopenicillin N synthase family dioxygenase n=1 Tax=Micromonospora noduli TaxID=709876 RepID=UPI000DC3C3B1|nr:2OG-Fe(II) oxygenase family protein [Micromonospora noduli]RAO30047.1 Aminocyclopropanecarboxylate oxidase [Micromonospora noduli]